MKTKAPPMDKIPMLRDMLKSMEALRSQGMLTHRELFDKYTFLRFYVWILPYALMKKDDVQ